MESVEFDESDESTLLTANQHADDITVTNTQPMTIQHDHQQVTPSHYELTNDQASPASGSFLDSNNLNASIANG